MEFVIEHGDDGRTKAVQVTGPAGAPPQGASLLECPGYVPLQRSHNSCRGWACCSTLPLLHLRAAHHSVHSTVCMLAGSQTLVAVRAAAPHMHAVSQAVLPAMLRACSGLHGQRCNQQRDLPAAACTTGHTALSRCRASNAAQSWSPCSHRLYRARDCSQSPTTFESVWVLHAGQPRREYDQYGGEQVQSTAAPPIACSASCLDGRVRFGMLPTMPRESVSEHSCQLLARSPRHPRLSSCRQAACDCLHCLLVDGG